MDKIKELIQEGEGLKGTFTTPELSSFLTTDITSVSTWVTTSARIVERKEKQGSNSQLYKSFEKHIGKINMLNKKEFEGLIGILKGIEATPEEEYDYPYN
jgi:hypothetical protein